MFLRLFNALNNKVDGYTYFYEKDYIQLLCSGICLRKHEIIPESLESLPYKIKTRCTAGKYFEFEWEAPINIRTGAGTNDGHQTGCPYRGRTPKVWKGFNDHASRNPTLAKQWHPVKNINMTPDAVTCSSGEYAWWYLPYDDPETGKHFDFEWRATINSRTEGAACPFLSGHAVWKGYNDLESCYPEIAKEYNTDKNRNRTPDKVYKEA